MAVTWQSPVELFDIATAVLTWKTEIFDVNLISKESDFHAGDCHGRPLLAACLAMTCVNFIAANRTTSYNFARMEEDGKNLIQCKPIR